MDWTLIVTGAISAISGGALAAFLTFKLGNRKQDESDFSTLVKEYKEMVESWKNEVKELREKVLEQDKTIILLQQSQYDREGEIRNLRNQLMIFESSNVDVPLPIWLKDTEGKMLFVNPEYERSLLQPIGKSATDYIGKTDVEVWGDKIGNQFLSHDRKVMRSKKPMEFLEQWKGAGGSIYEGKVVKYPRFLNRTVIGIGGIVVDIKQIKPTN